MSEHQRNEDLLPDDPPPRHRDGEFDDHDPLEGEPPPRSGEPAVVPRWIQLVALPLLLLLGYAIIKAAGTVALLFLTAAVIALILNPLVAGLQRFHLPRGVAIVFVYLGFVAALVVAGVLLANPISDQVTTLRDDIPSITDSANQRLADVQDYFDRKGINVEIKKQGHTALDTLQSKVVGGTDSIVSFGTDLLTKLVTASFGLILVFVLSVYMLIHGERIGSLMRGVMPPGDGTREDDYPARVVRAVAGYVRGQLLFSLVMGAGAGIGLWIFGVIGIFPDGKTYALAFGVWFGLMELVPYVGPFLGAVPPLLVALFQDPLTAVWVALLFVGLQQIEGHIASPLIFGHALRINPLLVIFALLFGAELFGIIGALVALPVAAVVRETVVYLRQHLVLEPWGTMTASEIVEARSSRVRCPECGGRCAAGDAYCPTCGADLARPEVPSAG
ncbi:MAG TPA: AI-2E family transporter [Solirubrobacteraceae bacterium]|nr:AI-2E family transporter [Solirubrobacteraceae bacterium]